MKKMFRSVILVLILQFAFVKIASAHVVVKPSEVGIGSFQTFMISVPNEKDSPTTEIKLEVPKGLKYVTPNVKPGWTISETSKDNNVSEIIWSQGSIPVGQRDEFLFSAQTPPSPVKLVWKAYQTYGNGEVVEWTHKPSSDHDDEENSPYSTTKVVNDISSENTSKTNTNLKNSNHTSYILSVAALGVSIAALLTAFRKGKK